MNSSRLSLLLGATCLVTACGGGAAGGSHIDSDASADTARVASVSTSADASPSVGTTACDAATGRRLLVGPGQTYTTIRAAAAAAQSGDVVVITAGDYRGDVATWPQSQLTLCGSGGRARLFANGQQAAGKGIWVIQGTNVVVDSIDFHDAKVPDRNGAGIRAEGNGLTILNSGFYDNENGILGPDRGELTIERSEFARNGFGDGFSHNLYVGQASRVTVRNSFFHEAKIGHNLKSRALETRIENSYFMDGANGTASYQIDVPNGGAVALSGNLLQKGVHADNSTLISYGSEGLRAGATHQLILSHNTLTSLYPGGSFIFANTGVLAVALRANLFAGTNGPTTYNSAVAPKVTESQSLVTTAASITAPANIESPNFWPLPALLPQTLLTVVPDGKYAADSPQPYTARPITVKQRRIGALQTAP